MWEYHHISYTFLDKLVCNIKLHGFWCSYLASVILLHRLYLQINRLESEFSSYKVRAHTLLQKKDAELAAAMDSEQLKAIEEALKVHA